MSTYQLDAVQSVRVVLYNILLGNVERQSKVAASIFRIEFGVVERFGVEVMYERTERHTVSPARREVGDVHMLCTQHDRKE